MAGAVKGNKHKSVLLLQMWNIPIGVIIPKFLFRLQILKMKDCAPLFLDTGKIRGLCNWDNINFMRKDGSSRLEMIPQVGPPCWKMTIQAHLADRVISTYRTRNIWVINEFVIRHTHWSILVQRIKIRTSITVWFIPELSSEKILGSI